MRERIKVQDQKADIAIIGAGLGGLECALILQRAGFNVCVAEKDPLIGGCLQTYRRQGVPLDTGFHYVGAMEPGQMLHKLMRSFGLLDLPWVKMDEECADEVVIEDRAYKIPQGFDRYQTELTNRFPAEEDGIRRWVKTLREVGENIERSLAPREAEDVYVRSLFGRSAYQELLSVTRNPELLAVLSGTALKMELNAESLPLYTFAQITGSFIQSAYRLRGGGMQIAERLRKNIEAAGGRVLRNAEVTQIMGEGGRATYLEINAPENSIGNSLENNKADGGAFKIFADTFISDLHPAATAALTERSGLLRGIYRRRMGGLKNTFGTFTLSLILKPQRVRYRNHNIYIYTSQDVWGLHKQAAEGDGTVRCALVSFAPPESEGDLWARNIDILTPMPWQLVCGFEGTTVGKRPDSYYALKSRYAGECLALARTRLPELTDDAIEAAHTSTPLTYNDYVAAPQGNAFGASKDYANLMYTLLTPRTPVPNLLLTGQSLNLHGVLGTSMTALFTCAEIIGMKNVKDQINNTD